MTDAELRELLRAATPGEWAVHPQFARIIPLAHANRPIGAAADLERDLNEYAQEICAMHHPDRHRPERETEANAALIAALRNAAPGMLDRIEALEAALQRIYDMAERPICLCGIPTGTAAIKSAAQQALEEK